MTSLRRIAQAVSVFFFMTTFLAVLGQASFRYLLNMPVGWAVEVAINAFLIGSWWTICWLVALRDHVTFDVVYTVLPERWQAVCRVIGGLFVCVLLLTALPGSLKYLEVMSRITTGVLKMPLSWVYWIFALFLVVLALRFLFDAVRAARALMRREPGA
jgi:TRAP-type C4-dicarboxylate transport system permease small subunit